MHPRAVACDPGLVAAGLARDGLRPMVPADFAAAGRMAALLIGPGLAPVEVVRAVAARCGCALFAHGPEGGVDGALAIVPVNRLGLQALLADRFDGANPPLEGVAAPGEPLAGVYGWGFVGSTRRATAAVVSGMGRLRTETYPRLPFFGRAATEAGRRVMEGRLGYSLQPGARSGLYRNLPSPLRRAA